LLGDIVCSPYDTKLSCSPVLFPLVTTYTISERRGREARRHAPAAAI